jgi:ribosomal protein S18 acetylase RimI-like enzyme
VISIRPLATKDFPQVVTFAIEGMHFDRYFQNPLALRAFGYYFVEHEYANATQALGAYEDGRLVGVLFASETAAPKPHATWPRRLLVASYQRLMHVFAGQGTPAYDAANADMLAAFTAKKAADGEISLLATDPMLQGRGIGSQLLAAFARTAKGKRYFLYTDSDCVYQFYDHRGFIREQTRQIELTLGAKQFPLTCMLYSQIF